MKGCFENIDQAVSYIKYLSEDDPNVSVKLYREAGCWYVEGGSHIAYPESVYAGTGSDYLDCVLCVGGFEQYGPITGDDK